ncbi:Beta-synuclein [Bagarius yarrelli]|uniref:Beta-synuclein n=1 Tax=Bagarius yarrelli TaxID=175774 RepID=A0A556V1Q4_BAGYA|nr:Beta-synuclein [Bagarius yarrelli]
MDVFMKGLSKAKEGMAVAAEKTKEGVAVAAEKTKEGVMFVGKLSSAIVDAWEENEKKSYWRGMSACSVVLLGGVVLSGAGNIAAATGLMKKDEFPSDMNTQDYEPEA